MTGCYDICPIAEGCRGALNEYWFNKNCWGNFECCTHYFQEKQFGNPQTNLFATGRSNISEADTLAEVVAAHQ